MILYATTSCWIVWGQDSVWLTRQLYLSNCVQCVAVRYLSTFARGATRVESWPGSVTVYTGKLFEIVCTLMQTRLSSLTRKTPTTPTRLTASTVLTAPTNYSDYSGLAPSILNIFITNLCYLVTLAAKPTQWLPLAFAQNSCGHLVNVWEKMWNL